MKKATTRDKVIASIIISPLVVMILCAAFLYFSYIHVLITEGEGYGYKFGMSKGEVFNTAKEKYKDEEIYYYTGHFTKEGYKFITLEFDERNLIKFSKLERWRFYFEESVRNYIELKFFDGKLIQIFRKRQYFELL